MQLSRSPYHTRSYWRRLWYHCASTLSLSSTCFQSLSPADLPQQLWWTSLDLSLNPQLYMFCQLSVWFDFTNDKRTKVCYLQARDFTNLIKSLKCSTSNSSCEIKRSEQNKLNGHITTHELAWLDIQFKVKTTTKSCLCYQRSKYIRERNFKKFISNCNIGPYHE